MNKSRRNYIKTVKDHQEEEEGILEAKNN